MADNRTNQDSDRRPSNGGATRLDVYTIRPAAREGGKAFWVRIGSAWKNRDNSLNIKLDALPVNGELQVRKPRPREDRDGE